MKSDFGLILYHVAWCTLYISGPHSHLYYRCVWVWCTCVSIFVFTHWSGIGKMVRIFLSSNGKYFHRKLEPQKFDFRRKNSAIFWKNANKLACLDLNFKQIPSIYLCRTEQNLILKKPLAKVQSATWIEQNVTWNIRARDTLTHSLTHIRPEEHWK